MLSLPNNRTPRETKNKPWEFLGPWHVVKSRERPKNRDRAKIISKKANDESDGQDRGRVRLGTGEDSAAGTLHYKALEQRQDDKDRKKEREASKYATPPAHRWTEGVSRLGTPSAQTPGERAGEHATLFSTLETAPARYGHQTGVAPPQQSD